MFLSPNSAKQELRIGNLPLALCCTLADTEVCMPTCVHGNISQFWFVLSVPTHHKYCTIPDSMSVNPCHVAAAISDLFWYWRSYIPTMIINIKTCSLLGKQRIILVITLRSQFGFLYNRWNAVDTPYITSF